MKKVVWSTTSSTGAAGWSSRWLRCPTSPGRTRTARAGAPTRAPAGGCGTGWCWPYRPTRCSALVPDLGAGSQPVDDWGPLLDGSFAGSVSLPRDPDGPSTAWLEQVFDEPVQVGAVTVGLPGPTGFAAAPPPSAVLEASDDGVTYRRVAELDAPGNADKAVPVRTLAFPPVTARRFRLVLTGASAEEGLPRLAEGVRLPPILRRVSEFLVSEFALFPGGRVHQAELKAGFAAAPDYYALDTPADGGDRPRPDRRRHALRRGRRPALGGAGRGVADPPAGRLADRADERPGLAGGDRTRGRQARRGEGARLPRHLPGALRRRGAGRPAQRQHRVRRAEPHRPAARAVHRAARLRPDAVAARAGRARRGRCGAHRPVPVGLPADDRRPRGERVLRHARAGGARPRARLLRRGARGPPSAARQRPGDAQPRRRARWAPCGCSTPARAGPSPPTSPT